MQEGVEVMIYADKCPGCSDALAFDTKTASYFWWSDALENSIKGANHFKFYKMGLPFRAACKTCHNEFESTLHIDKAEESYICLARVTK